MNKTIVNMAYGAIMGVIISIALFGPILLELV